MTEPLSVTIAHAGMGVKVPTKDWKIIEVWDWQVREWSTAAAALEAEVGKLKRERDAATRVIWAYDSWPFEGYDRLPQAKDAIAKEQER